VLGYSPWERKSEYLRKISILLGQKAQLWWDIPAADSFGLLARIYDIEEKEARRRVTELAELLQCRELLHIQLRRLSLGERMKMEIIGSLLHRPRVLFLDEPTIGLDVVAQTTIREFLSDYVKRERPTIVLTSHYMDDISRLANRLLLISKGAIVYEGSVNDFMAQSERKQRLTVRLDRTPTESIVLEPGLTLAAGEPNFSAEVPVARMASTLERLMAVSSISEIKIEEADFEDIIRKFLEKEPRLRANVGPLAP
jgi:ABC-2 type transport system ATP-binding protein